MKFERFTARTIAVRVERIEAVSEGMAGRVSEYDCGRVWARWDASMLGVRVAGKVVGRVAVIEGPVGDTRIEQET